MIKSIRAVRLTSCALIALFLVALATSPASAETFARAGVQNSDVADQLKELKGKAFELRREADVLNSITPNKQMHWQSHTYRLNALKDNVNDLGKRLTELETLQPQASDVQKMAIANARPHLVAVAQQLTQAIDLVAENRRSVHGTPYTDTVRNIYTHAASLYRTVDTLFDYENARMRLDNLGLPTSVEGS